MRRDNPSAARPPCAKGWRPLPQRSAVGRVEREVLRDLTGQVFALLILTVAAAEAAIGLAILVAYYRNRGSIAVEDIHALKG